MIEITNSQLRDLIENYDANKGQFRKSSYLSLIIGDQQDIAALKKFYDNLIENTSERNLSQSELFALARIIITSSTTPESESDKVFSALKSCFGQDVIAALTFMYENKIYLLNIFDVIIESEHPIYNARLFWAKSEINKQTYPPEIKQWINTHIEEHPSPHLLVQGLLLILRPQYSFCTQENINKVLTDKDPLLTAQTIVIPVLLPNFDFNELRNPSILTNLKILYHYDYQTLPMFSDVKAGSNWQNFQYTKPASLITQLNSNSSPSLFANSTSPIAQSDHSAGSDSFIDIPLKNNFVTSAKKT